MKQNDNFKLGIQIGDQYGRAIFDTKVTDQYKAIEEANKFISSKYNKNMALGLINNTHKNRRK